MIPKQEFGKTGHLSTRLLFGAAAFHSVTQYEADTTMELLTKHGINHIDTAASYGDSEKRLGPWMKHHRKEVFLATKTEMRTKKEAKEELYRSFDRLNTDNVDLWQMHVLIKESEWETAMAIDGAIEAFLEARDEGLVRYLGVTGHELIAPVMHNRSLDRYNFDSVLMPYNYILMKNAEYKKNWEHLYQRCCENNVAVQCIKTACRRPWGIDKQNKATWYQPFETEKALETAIGWALSKEGVFVNSAGDITILPLILKAAEKFDSAYNYENDMVKLAEDQGMAPLFV